MNLRASLQRRQTAVGLRSGPVRKGPHDVLFAQIDRDLNPARYIGFFVCMPTLPSGKAVKNHMSANIGNAVRPYYSDI